MLSGKKTVRIQGGSEGVFLRTKCDRGVRYPATELEAIISFGDSPEFELETVYARHDTGAESRREELLFRLLRGVSRESYWDLKECCIV